MPRNKIYLGDGAYAELDDRGVVLTAENGIRATDTVALGTNEVQMLLRWLFGLNPELRKLTGMVQ